MRRVEVPEKLLIIFVIMMMIGWVVITQFIAMQDCKRDLREARIAILVYQGCADLGYFVACPCDGTVMKTTINACGWIPRDDVNRLWKDVAKN